MFGVSMLLLYSVFDVISLLSLISIVQPALVMMLWDTSAP